MKHTALVVSFLALSACGDSASSTDTADTASSPDTVDTVDTVDAADTSGPDAPDPDTQLGPDVDPDTADASPDTTPDLWDAPPSTLSVSVQTWAGGTPRTSIGGALRADAMPNTYVVADATDDCRLLLGENPFCDPFCDGTLCTAPNVCTPYPALLSAGTLTVSGGGGRPVVLEPDVTGYGTSFEAQTFADGTAITFAAAGGEVPAFAETLTAPPTIVVADLDRVSLKSPLVFDWDAPTTSNDTRVLIRLQADRGQHGRALSAILECDVPDTGHFEIPSTLQSQYVADDLWGCGKCPASSITRYAAKRIQVGSHEVALRVESSAVFLLTTWTNAQ
ncbi:MAG: hypothetical protein JNJ59_16145 [Deltaproteobacteria bacterium]|nr:hypothetical protein [Deltaproteobacteria bacterium]